jgi:multidrug efflux pump subunit AcrB
MQVGHRIFRASERTVFPPPEGSSSSDQQSRRAKLLLTIDRDQAARSGIQPALIDNTLYDAFGQC